MATTPKISIRLGLDGKEEVLGGLGEIKNKGLDTFNALKNQAGNALGDGCRHSDACRCRSDRGGRHRGS